MWWREILRNGKHNPSDYIICWHYLHLNVPYIFAHKSEILGKHFRTEEEFRLIGTITNNLVEILTSRSSPLEQADIFGIMSWFYQVQIFSEGYPKIALIFKMHTAIQIVSDTTHLESTSLISWDLEDNRICNSSIFASLLCRISKIFLSLISDCSRSLHEKKA